MTNHDMPSIPPVLPANQRLVSVDALRGITIALMIAVNNGGGPLSFGQLQHSDWNGLTLCDMVFPAFLFILGISTCLSLSKAGFEWSSTAAVKIVRRSVLILLIGWAIQWFDSACHGNLFPVSTLRLTGVLPRIAVCYFATAAIVLSFSRRGVIIITFTLLVIYGIILVSGNGFANDDTNIISRVDHAIFGSGHLYTKRPIDPEGLLGTIGAVSHTLLGFCFGVILTNKRRQLTDRLLQIMVLGFMALLAGLLISQWGLPVNKRVWSPSYVLVTCGLTALSLGVIAYITDIRGNRRIFTPFLVYGVNPLFLYVLSDVVAIILGTTGAKHAIYGFINSIITNAYMASAVYAFALSALMGLIGYPLYKRNIFIKI